ncbi:MAG: hypothetical protein JEZ08_05935 [Clostridiales bacterium]|nr:hypothetical protein [Clostridiales bacterium]
MRDLSIKKKLFMVVLSLILGFMIVLLLIVFFFEDFFIYTLKEVFKEEATETIEVNQNNHKNRLNTLKVHNDISGYKYVNVDRQIRHQTCGEILNWLVNSKSVNVEHA